MGQDFLDIMVFKNHVGHTVYLHSGQTVQMWFLRGFGTNCWMEEAIFPSAGGCSPPLSNFASLLEVNVLWWYNTLLPNISRNAFEVLILYVQEEVINFIYSKFLNKIGHYHKQRTYLPLATTSWIHSIRKLSNVLYHIMSKKLVKEVLTHYI